MSEPSQPLLYDGEEPTVVLKNELGTTNRDSGEGRVLSTSTMPAMCESYSSDLLPGSQPANGEAIGSERPMQSAEQATIPANSTASRGPSSSFAGYRASIATPYGSAGQDSLLCSSLKVTIVSVTYSMTDTLRKDFGDPVFSPTFNAVTKRCPVIHIFGHTVGMPKQLSVCLHVHGSLPYFLVPRYNDLISSEDFAGQLEVAAIKALSLKPNSQVIHHVGIVKATPFYGYYESQREFFKIFVYNPSVVVRLVNLLGSSTVVGGRRWQPHEGHIPYVFQFMLDHSLSGMSIVEFDSGTVRYGSVVPWGMNEEQDTGYVDHDGASEEAKATHVAEVTKVQTPFTYSLDSSAIKVSTCDLEMDINVEAIQIGGEKATNFSCQPSSSDQEEGLTQREPVVADSDATLSANLRLCKSQLLQYLMTERGQSRAEAVGVLELAVRDHYSAAREDGDMLGNIKSIQHRDPMVSYMKSMLLRVLQSRNSAAMPRLQPAPRDIPAALTPLLTAPSDGAGIATAQLPQLPKHLPALSSWQSMVRHQRAREDLLMEKANLLPNPHEPTEVEHIWLKDADEDTIGVCPTFNLLDWLREDGVDMDSIGSQREDAIALNLASDYTADVRVSQERFVPLTHAEESSSSSEDEDDIFVDPSRGASPPESEVEADQFPEVHTCLAGSKRFRRSDSDSEESMPLLPDYEDLPLDQEERFTQPPSTDAAPNQGVPSASIDQVRNHKPSIGFAEDDEEHLFPDAPKQHLKVRRVNFMAEEDAHVVIGRAEDIPITRRVENNKVNESIKLPMIDLNTQRASQQHFVGVRNDCGDGSTGSPLERALKVRLTELGGTSTEDKRCDTEATLSALVSFVPTMRAPKFLSGGVVVAPPTVSKTAKQAPKGQLTKSQPKVLTQTQRRWLEGEKITLSMLDALRDCRPSAPQLTAITLRPHGNKASVHDLNRAPTFKVPSQLRPLTTQQRSCIAYLRVASIEVMPDTPLDKEPSYSNCPILAIGIGLTESTSSIVHYETLFVDVGGVPHTPQQQQQVGDPPLLKLQHRHSTPCPNEASLIVVAIDKLKGADPDVILSWDTSRFGIGYLLERAAIVCGIDGGAALSRLRGSEPTVKAAPNLCGALAAPQNSDTVAEDGTPNSLMRAVNSSDAFLQGIGTQSYAGLAPQPSGLLGSSSPNGLDDDAVDVAEPFLSPQRPMFSVATPSEAPILTPQKAIGTDKVLPTTAFLGSNAAAATDDQRHKNVFQGLFVLPKRAIATRIVGRIVLPLHKLVHAEVRQKSYTLQAVYFSMFGRTYPNVRAGKVAHLFKGGDKDEGLVPLGGTANGYHRAAALALLEADVMAVLCIAKHMDFYVRSSEMAQLYGIQLFETVSRGSQFRVESFMKRVARPYNYVMISPSKEQIMRQNRQEAIPLVMEPYSGFYTDPVIVLDFRSLYPSVVMAYNLCYSTCLGKVSKNEHKKIGAVQNYRVKDEVLKRLLEDDLITFAPNSCMYVRAEERMGVLPIMLESILNTRFQVQSVMKSAAAAGDDDYRRVLDARQLGLKLLANVTFGYTAATFTGRMPCSDIADSIVLFGRSALEEAIRTVSDNPVWNAKVVYGDTDSIFIQLPGRSKDDAFEIASEMCTAINCKFPSPITIKFEKVYMPCFMITKKRYVGYAYESKAQKIPRFDAKGIETVRRDQCGATSKVLEEALRVLFDSIYHAESHHDNPSRTRGLEYQVDKLVHHSTTIPSLMPHSPSEVTKHNVVAKLKRYFYEQAHKIQRGDVHPNDLILRREVKLGTYTSESSLPPAARVAMQMMQRDPDSCPAYGERVPYIVLYPRAGKQLKDMVADPHRLLSLRRTEVGPSIPRSDDSSPAGCSPYFIINGPYYLAKHIIPSLDRIFAMTGISFAKWYAEMPRSALRNEMALTHHSYFEGLGEKGKEKGAVDQYFSKRECVVCHRQAVITSTAAQSGFHTDPVNRPVEDDVEEVNPFQRHLTGSKKRRVEKNFYKNDAGHSAALMMGSSTAVSITNANISPNRSKTPPSSSSPSAHRQFPPICPHCVAEEARPGTLATLAFKRRAYEAKHHDLVEQCHACLGCWTGKQGPAGRGASPFIIPDVEDLCLSIDCPITFEKHRLRTLIRHVGVLEGFVGNDSEIAVLLRVAQRKGGVIGNIQLPLPSAVPPSATEVILLSTQPPQPILEVKVSAPSGNVLSKRVPSPQQIPSKSPAPSTHKLSTSAALQPPRSYTVSSSFAADRAKVKNNSREKGSSTSQAKKQSTEKQAPANAHYFELTSDDD